MSGYWNSWEWNCSYYHKCSCRRSCWREVVVFGGGMQPAACSCTEGSYKNKSPAISFLLAPQILSVLPIGLTQLEISWQGNLPDIPFKVSLLGHGTGRKAQRVDLEGNVSLCGTGAISNRPSKLFCSPSTCCPLMDPTSWAYAYKGSRAQAGLSKEISYKAGIQRNELEL